MKQASLSENPNLTQPGKPDRYIHQRIDYMMECFAGAAVGAFSYFAGVLVLFGLGAIANIAAFSSSRQFLGHGLSFLGGGILGLVFATVIAAFLSVVMTWFVCAFNWSFGNFLIVKDAVMVSAGLCGFLVLSLPLLNLDWLTSDPNAWKDLANWRRIFAYALFGPGTLCCVMSFAAGRFEQKYVRYRFECTFDESSGYRLKIIHLFAATSWIAGMLAVSMALFADARLLLLFFVYVVFQAVSLALVKRLLRYVNAREVATSGPS